MPPRKGRRAETRITGRESCRFIAIQALVPVEGGGGGGPIAAGALVVAAMDGSCPSVNALVCGSSASRGLRAAQIRAVGNAHDTPYEKKLGRRDTIVRPHSRVPKSLDSEQAPAKEAARTRKQDEVRIAITVRALVPRIQYADEYPYRDARTTDTSPAIHNHHTNCKKRTINNDRQSSAKKPDDRE
jgi:hypothetical protein